MARAVENGGLHGGEPSMSGDDSGVERTLARALEKGGLQGAGKRYWRSLNEVAGTAEFRAFVEREFPEHASEWLDEKGQAGEDCGEGRRTFLKVMGASLALAGLASCRRWPEEKLTPYAHRQPGRMDGVPVHYATAFESGVGWGRGWWRCRLTGRPIKVDGNPAHPLTKGASDVFLQASVLDVYDPDRSRGPVVPGGRQAVRRRRGRSLRRW